MIQKLVEYLREHRGDVVRSVDVMVEVYDPTYGLQDPRTETIDVVDFDKLLKAIDEFCEEFKDAR